MMELSAVAETLEALGHPARLKIVELLAHEPEGLAAGQIATRLGVGNSTLSTQLKTLLRAGVLDSDRRGRQIIYSCDIDGILFRITKLLRIMGPNVSSRIRHQI